MKQWIPLLITLPVLGNVVVIDIRQHRIPNKYVILLLCLLLTTLYIASELLDEPAAFSRSITGGFCAFLFFLSLHAISPTGLGLGDVKLSGVLGATLTWDSFNTLFYGIATMFTVAALFSIYLLIIDRRNIKTYIPFAPFMIVGTIIGILAF
jgi:leader peptidase (prepilin peptidase)/N-methyltransferase